MKLTLVSIGINSHMDISLKGVEAARQADRVYAEMYTMKMDTTLAELAELAGQQVIPLPSRILRIYVTSGGLPRNRSLLKRSLTIN